MHFAKYMQMYIKTLFTFADGTSMDEETCLNRYIYDFKTLGFIMIYNVIKYLQDGETVVNLPLRLHLRLIYIHFK